MQHVQAVESLHTCPPCGHCAGQSMPPRRLTAAGGLPPTPAAAAALLAWYAMRRRKRQRLADAQLKSSGAAQPGLEDGVGDEFLISSSAAKHAVSLSEAARAESTPASLDSSGFSAPPPRSPSPATGSVASAGTGGSR